MLAQLVEITDPGLAYMCLGGFVVAFSMVSLFAREKLYINEVILGTTFGVLVGPHVGNIFNPRSWLTSPTGLDKLTLEVMRIVLVTGLFAIGVELPKSYMYDHARSLLTLVVPTMAIGWLIVSALLKALFPKLGFLACLAIASCLTPTDPIICAAIVGGEFAKRHVPENLRQLISAESAANDGLAYPFLRFAIYLILDGTSREGVRDWFLIGILYQVVMGTVIGALLGWGFSRFMKFADRTGLIDRESYVAQYLALSVFIAGFVSTIGSDDLLAAFAAGNAISWDGSFNERTKGELFATVIDLVLNCACFIYIGAWLPFASFNMPELGITPWRLVVLCIGILFLRRIPALLVLYRWIPEIRNWKEALFTGHFGPMGVGAVFVMTLALHKLPEPHYPPETQTDMLALTLQPIVTFVVLGSIIIHGLSIPFFTLGRTVKSRTSTLTTYAWTYTRAGTPNRSGLPEWINQITAGSAAAAPGILASSPGAPYASVHAKGDVVERSEDIRVEVGDGESIILTTEGVEQDARHPHRQVRVFTPPSISPPPPVKTHPASSSGAPDSSEHANGDAVERSEDIRVEVGDGESIILTTEGVEQDARHPHRQVRVFTPPSISPPPPVKTHPASSPGAPDSSEHANGDAVERSEDIRVDIDDGESIIPTTEGVGQDDDSDARHPHRQVRVFTPPSISPPPPARTHPAPVDVPASSPGAPDSSEHVKGDVVQRSEDIRVEVGDGESIIPTTEGVGQDDDSNARHPHRQVRVFTPPSIPPPPPAQTHPPPVDDTSTVLIGEIGFDTGTATGAPRL